MKKAGIIMLILGAVTCFASTVIPLYSIVFSLLKPNADVGIIGGKDGPTLILVATNAFRGLPSTALFLGVCTLVAGIVLLIAAKKKK